jgi:UDP-glucose 6-dehydrogenase
MNRGTVAILGTGYVGTANAVGFAELGCDVIGFDTDARRIHALGAGIPPYREAGLGELLERHLTNATATSSRFAIRPALRHRFFAGNRYRGPKRSDCG